MTTANISVEHRTEGLSETPVGSPVWMPPNTPVGSPIGSPIWMRADTPVEAPLEDLDEGTLEYRADSPMSPMGRPNRAPGWWIQRPVGTTWEELVAWYFELSETVEEMQAELLEMRAWLLAEETAQQEQEGKKQTSSLLSLDSEIRNKIFEYTVSFEPKVVKARELCPIPNERYFEAHNRRPLDEPTMQPAVTRVCRKFREEALPLYYQHNTFYMPGTSTQNGRIFSQDRFPCHSGSYQLRRIGKVHFKTCILETCDFGPDTIVEGIHHVNVMICIIDDGKDLSITCPEAGENQAVLRWLRALVDQIAGHPEAYNGLDLLNASVAMTEKIECRDPSAGWSELRGQGLEFEHATSPEVHE